MKALIFGVTGQDGSYLADFLLNKKYKVTGVGRRCSHYSHERIEHLKYISDFNFVEGDITDFSSIVNIIRETQPDEIYGLAAQSHVGTSFKQPLYTWDVTAKGCMNILEAIRVVNPKIKMYQASSSEMFGDQYSIDTNGVKYQDEQTPMRPQSPYANAKLAAYNATRLYRHAYNMFISNGILFNHESSRRGQQFVTRKITLWIGEFINWMAENHTEPEKLDFEDTYVIYKDKKFSKLALGNLHASRDWGHAKDYCRAMWLIMQYYQPDDFVIATGQTHSVEDFVKTAFKCVCIDNYRDFIYVDPQFVRPQEVPFLRGVSQKARIELDWQPEYTFNQLVEEMVQEDLYRCQNIELIQAT